VSSFAGIFLRDGAVLPDDALEPFARAMKASGLGEARTWRGGGVGFACAGTARLASLGDDLCLVGQIRLDDRAGLLARLGPSGSAPDDDDAVLALRAYRRWGSPGFQWLRGDYAFAIWDTRAQRLACARDYFGMKPFFHATGAGACVFASQLALVRDHPSVSPQVDEVYIADFLVFGQQQDASATVHADVRRLAGGHSLEVEPRSSGSMRHTALPSSGPYLRHSTEQEYVEHFAEVISAAVADRAGDRAVLQLSGGLDSAVIGGVLAGKLGRRPTAAASAVCVSWEKYFDDPEPAFAQASAQALGLPLQTWRRTDCDPFLAGDAAAAEPSAVLFQGSTSRDLRGFAQLAPVVLSGQGGDEVFFRELLLDELRATFDWRLLVDAASGWATYGRPPLGVRENLRAAFGARQRFKPLELPAWISPQWAREQDIAGRVDAYRRKWAQPARESHACARERLTPELWQPVGEETDFGNTGVAAELRFPFLDWRVVSFALSLPPFPWCANRTLLRRTVARWAPELIWRRPKTPLQADPLLIYLQEQADWREQFSELDPSLERWIDPQLWRATCARFKPGDPSSDAAWAMARVMALNAWVVRSRNAGRAGLA
jgi:asparagine synthase (glutamine-hydrolysing)